MTPDEAEDWLAVAVGEVLHYPADVLAKACGEARRTCTHHSQIVPAVVKHGDAEMADRNRYRDWDIPRLPPPPPAPMEPELFERIVAGRGRALSVCLDRGTIISNGDGTFRLP